MSYYGRARWVATTAHRNQFRRWPKEPYIFHCARVAAVTEAHLVALYDSNLQDARDVAVHVAWLHDVIEDSAEWDFQRVCEEFGDAVGAGVRALTKEKGQPEEEYLARLSRGPRYLRQIKLIDRSDNLSGPFPLYEAAGLRFVEKYIPETLHMLEAFKGTDEVLEGIVRGKLEIIQGLVNNL